jgi:predicted phosphodiesterase
VPASEAVLALSVVAVELVLGLPDAASGGAVTATPLLAGTPVVPAAGGGSTGDATGGTGLRDAEHAAAKKRAEVEKFARIRSAPYQSSCKNQLNLSLGITNEEAGRDGARAFARLGLIGDVHAEDEALELVLDDFTRRGVDTILCVGDIADGSGDVNRCCALLAERGVLTVIGNHDRWLLADEHRELAAATPRNKLDARSRAFLDALPATRSFSTPYGSLLLCHGVGDDDMAGVKPDHLRHDLERNDALKRVLAGPRFDWMVNGHTHRAMVRRVRHLTILNAGTLHRTDERRAVVVDFPARTATFFEVLPTGLSEHESVTLPDVDEWSRT